MKVISQKFELANLFNGKTPLVLGSLIVLTLITLTNVWVSRKSTQTESQARSKITRFYWLPSSVKSKVNQVFTASLMLDPGQPAVSALDVIITYDSQVLELQSHTLNQDLTTFPVEKNEPGRFIFSALPKDFVKNPNFSSGILVSFSFAAKTSNNTTTQILIDPESIAAFEGKNLLTLDTDARLTVEVE